MEAVYILRLTKFVIIQTIIGSENFGHSSPDQTIPQRLVPSPVHWSGKEAIVTEHLVTKVPVHVLELGNEDSSS